MSKHAPQGVLGEDGHWRPAKFGKVSPLFSWPPQIGGIVRWLFGWGGFIFPRHASYMVLALVTYYKLTPLSWIEGGFDLGGIPIILLRNLALICAVCGFYHITLYTMKLQGTDGKYHPKWQAKNNSKFLFNNQVLDNMFWSIVSGVPIWTAWEALHFYFVSRGLVRVITFESNTIWFVALFFLIPFWRDLHFYTVHRVLHFKPLLRLIHSIHHKNPNPGPWSGMSMHPVEHIVYLSTAAVFLVVPSHPIHVLYTLLLTALAPAQGHTGFHGPLFGGIWPVGDYFHYLHHKHVACNYGGGVIPLDKWFGTFFDGQGKLSYGKSKRGK